MDVIEYFAIENESLRRWARERLLGINWNIRIDCG